MKIVGLTALILFSVASLVQAQNQITLRDSVENNEYMVFKNEVRCNNLETATQCLSRQHQKQEVDRWKRAIRKAAGMLPPEFFKQTGKISWKFFIDRNDWVTAYASFSTIDINLLSNYKDPPLWMTWEPLGKDGLLESEMIFVSLHEMAHIYIYRDELNILDEMGVVNKAWTEWNKEEETTLYGKERGQAEDFAETFALYIMFPEQLKKYFPLHYGVIKNILATEYESMYLMPSSLQLRVSVQDHEKNDK